MLIRNETQVEVRNNKNNTTSCQLNIYMKNMYITSRRENNINNMLTQANTW